MKNNKILFAGPTGVGKSTAIASISDVPVLATEESAVTSSGDATTFMMDYGMLKLDTGDRLHLYGTPGQKKVSPVREALNEDCIGLIMLVDNEHDDPINELFQYIDTYKHLVEKGAIAVGVTRHANKTSPTINNYQQVFRDKNLKIPAFSVESYSKNDVIMLLQALLFNLDAGVQ